MCGEYSIKRIGRRVYFSGEVTQSAMNELKSELEECVNTALCQRAQWISLYIDSEGGNGFASLGMADYIEDMDRVPVCAVINGVALSAAMTIAMACDKIRITRNSIMMIHHGYESCLARSTDFHNYADFSKKWQERFTDWYADRIRQTAKDPISRAELSARLKDDFWMDANEAFRRGFVDEVI